MTTASEGSGTVERVLAPLVKVDAAARRVVAESPIGGFLEFAREKGVDLWLLSIYLGLAPVYWLPIPVIGGEDNRFPLLIVKTLLIAAGVAISIAGDWMNARFRFPGILLGPLGFFLIFALSLPGVVQAASVGESVRFALDIVFAALFLWCFFNLTRRGPAVFIVFKRAFAILVALSVAAAIVVLADADDLYPHRWDSAFVSGFGDKGSGWAIGLALLMPVALMFITTWEGARERVWIFLRGAAVYAIIASQFISGGRAGLLASFFVMGAFLFSRSTRVMVISVLAALVLTVAIFGNTSWGRYLGLHFFPAEFIAAPLRVERPTPTPLPFTPTPAPTPVPAAPSGETTPPAPAGPSELEIKTNAFTANRVTSLRTGIEKIQERPLTGHGLKQITVRYEAFGKVRFAEIHNLWIKWAAYTGIFGPIMMAVVAVAILRIGVKNLSVAWRLARDRMSAAALCLILIVGAVSTMFEPNVLVGSFQLTALWWAAAGCALGMWAEANEDGGADFESDGGE